MGVSTAETLFPLSGCDLADSFPTPNPAQTAPWWIIGHPLKLPETRGGLLCTRPNCPGVDYWAPSPHKIVELFRYRPASGHP